MKREANIVTVISNKVKKDLSKFYDGETEVIYNPVKDVKLNKVMDCIKMANLSKRINSFSQGIYTKIGDRGLRLSGGERQRLAIARALYSEKKIIIFDEATSAVDSETEKEIVKSITNLKKQKTMIIIAHRINTLKICDKIYLMKNGRIFGSGSYNNLLKKNSYFKKLNGW